MQTEGTEATPTVSSVYDETIVELVYDAVRKETALAVGKNGNWQCVKEHHSPVGHHFIPYSATNNLIAHGCVLLPSEPQPLLSKSVLIADIEAYLHRYVDFSPLFEKIAAHYILLSWVHDAFSEIPILRVRGAYGSGKTRALIALGSIAYRGFFASGASTVSPIFHTLDRFGGTLVLDEADLRFSDKTVDLVKILNNGTVRGLPVLRTLQSRAKEFNPAAFSVFGPKIVAMRGAFRDEALESRFLTEQMGNRPLRADIPIEQPASLAEEALVLRNRLLDFRLQHRFAVSIDPTRKIEGLDPRLNQMALPLLSLMDDPKLREDFASLMRQQQETLAIEREASVEARVSSALVQARKERKGNIALSDIANRANRDADQTLLSVRDVGRALRELSMPLRKSHGVIVVPALTQ